MISPALPGIHRQNRGFYFLKRNLCGRTDALAGKWDFDGTTAYEFDSKGSGAMLLTLADYDFTYEIKDNQLYIDFVNESAHDATYEFSVKGDTLILIGGEGTIGGTYELTKVHDKKADK